MIWTGARNGTEIVYGDVLLDRGLVVAVGYIPPSLLDGVRQLSGTTEIRVEDLGGAWVTPGLVDLHSHLGVLSAPYLSGQSLSFPPRWRLINGFTSRCIRR
jgi:imidazolonepropionase-like amidohydrolase